MRIQEDPSYAGQVARWHTWPRVRQQTVADHSWGVVRLVLAFWPGCRMQLVTQALTHDIGEIRAGDTPFPSKRDNPRLAMEVAREEERAHLAMVLPWSLPAPATLTHEEQLALRLADSVECLEDSMREVQLGNWHCEASIDAMYDRAVRTIAELRDCGMGVVSDSAQTYLARRMRQHALTQER